MARDLCGEPCTEPIPDFCQELGFVTEPDGDISFTGRVDLNPIPDEKKIVTDFEPPP